MILVLGVVVCFCIQLSYIRDASVGEVVDGFVPSSAIIRGQGIYLSCGILGATVMPHSLYLGSGLVQPRLMDFDVAAGNYSGPDVTDRCAKNVYRPSLNAIRSCLGYSTAEVRIFGVQISSFEANFESRDMSWERSLSRHISKLAMLP